MQFWHPVDMNLCRGSSFIHRSGLSSSFRCSIVWRKPQFTRTGRLFNASGYIVLIQISGHIEIMGSVPRHSEHVTSTLCREAGSSTVLFFLLPFRSTYRASREHNSVKNKSHNSVKGKNHTYWIETLEESSNVEGSAGRNG